MKNIYDVLKQKELQFEQLKRELDALRVAAKLLDDTEASKRIPASRQQRMSQSRMIEAVLRQAEEPLHVSKIMEAIKARFNRKLKTTHLAAVIYRNIKAGRLFYKEPERPSTFGLQQWKASQPPVGHSAARVIQ
jgi:hypothetical protein